MRKTAIALLLLSVLVSALLVGCGTQDTGTLQFYANGEDFVRQGFVSKDGWSISFDHVYIHLADVAGYQTEPPYDPHSGGALKVGHIIDQGSRVVNSFFRLFCRNLQEWRGWIS